MKRDQLIHADALTHKATVPCLLMSILSYVARSTKETGNMYSLILWNNFQKKKNGKY